MPQAIWRITDFTNLNKIEIPPLENKLPDYPDGYFLAWLLEEKIKEQFLKQIQKINADLSENNFTITFNSEPYKSKMDDLKSVYICTRKNPEKCNSEDTEFNITIIGKNNAKGKFTTTINLADFYWMK